MVPHFTTLADFIATLHREIVSLFRDVLLVCDEAGLIGREMFAVDGVKLPSNASKEWSATRKEFGKKVAKMQRASHREDGEAAEALNVCRRCRGMLSIVLGTKPSAETETVRGTFS